jgi:hypothetical protein
LLKNPELPPANGSPDIMAEPAGRQPLVKKEGNQLQNRISFTFK